MGVPSKDVMHVMQGTTLPSGATLPADGAQHQG